MMQSDMSALVLLVPWTFFTAKNSQQKYLVKYLINKMAKSNVLTFYCLFVLLSTFLSTLV